MKKNKATDLFKISKDNPEVTDICPVCGKKFYEAYLKDNGTVIFIHTPRELAETEPIIYCKAPTSKRKPNDKSGFQKQLEFIQNSKEELS